MITLANIEEKLGFDPMNPPEREGCDTWTIDDATPSIWAPLNKEEMLYVLENCMGVSKEWIEILSK